MVKINDPRGDTAAISMRLLRANNAFKSIKKMLKKSKYFDEDKLNLHKTDQSFYNDFVTCPENIKKELIFLWEEVGDLYEELESNNESVKLTETDHNVVLNLDKNLPPPPPPTPIPKRNYITGP